MTPNESAARPVVPDFHDPIRIVPLHVPTELTRHTPENAQATAPPQLTYRGGPLLTNVKVYPIFWGSAWHGSQSQLMTHITDFFKFVLTSPLLDQMAEYNTPQLKIGHGSLVGTTVLTSPGPPKTTTDTAVRHMLQNQISLGHPVPKPDANTLYFVYLPPGVTVVQGGSKSCQAFCGYHNAFSNQIFYAVMPYPGCTGCTGGLNVLDALTSTSSHELCEAITDPIPGQGWYDDANGEIGDICAWTTKKIGQWTVQQEWSNQQNKCI